MAKAKTPRATTSTPRSKRAATPQFQSVSEPRESSNGSSGDIQSEIRQRAYELYQERGYLSGYEQEDWIIAEREVLARHSLQLV